MNYDVAAQLILTQLKLHDLLDMELRQLQQQQQLRYQRESTLSGSSPVIVPSHRASSQPSSTPVSRSLSTTSSLPFELPDVNISDLLSTSIQSLNNVRSPLLSSVSPAISALSRKSSQQLSCTEQSSKKKASSRKSVNENCHRNNAENGCQISAGNSNKPSGTKTISAGDSRKRQSSRHSALSLDSDDEFEDSYRSNAAKKRIEADEWKTDCSLAAADKVINKTDVEASSEQQTSVVTGMTNSRTCCSSDVCSTASNSPVTTPITPNGGSLHRKVAQRLSKFAFKDNILRQRQESSTDDNITSQTAQHAAGN